MLLLLLLLSCFSRARLCDPIDGSPPGSPVPGILQARTLEWVVSSFSNAWKWKLKAKSFSRVWLFATPWTAAYQAPLSLGFSRQEYWSRLPFPSPMHRSEKWKWSRSVVFDSSRPHGLQPTKLLRPWDFPGKSTGVGCHCLLRLSHLACSNTDHIKSIISNNRIFVAFLSQAEIIVFDEVFYFLSNSRKKNYSGKTIKDLIFSYINIKNVQL